MKTPYLSALLFVCLLSAVSWVAGQTLKADYNFDGNLISSIPGAPNLMHLVGSGPNSFESSIIDGYTRQTLRFPFNSGVALFNTNTVIPNNSYTVVALFRFDDLTGFRRIGDFKNGTSQTGAYFLDGRFESEPTTNPALLPGIYFQAVLVRESTGRVRAYRDGVFRVDIPNDSGLYQISTDNVLRFAQDDFVSGGQASAGNLVRLRLYDGPMSSIQVAALDRLPNANGGGNQALLFSSTRDGSSEIYTMKSDGGNQRRLTNSSATEFQSKWSPNGQKILYTRRETSTAVYQIWIMNHDGTGQTRLTNTTTNDQSPEWKPDGSKIVFSRCNTDFLCDLYTMNPDGSNQAILPNINTSDDEDEADFSADGSKIVFGCSNATFTNGNICIANSDGTGRQQLTNDGGIITNRSPAISPDGTKIAFARYSDSANIATAEIYVMNVDGTNQVRLTNNSVFEYNPVWSPDNTRIAFTTGRDLINEVYLMNANGTSVTRLTANSRSEAISDWHRPGQTSVVSGRIVQSDGRGVTNANVAISNAQGIIQTVVTGRLGTFTFTNVPTGGNYTITPISRRYSFPPRTVQVDDNLWGIDFIQGQSLTKPESLMSRPSSRSSSRHRQFAQRETGTAVVQ